jgi:hypothetical protein
LARWLPHLSRPVHAPQSKLDDAGHGTTNGGSSHENSTALVATLFALTSIPLLGQQSPPDSQSASPAMQQSSPPGAQPEQPAPDNQPSSPAAQPNQPGSQAAQPEQPSSQAASPETSAPAVDMRPVRGFEVVGQGYPPVYTDDSLITIGLRFRIYRIIYTL